MSGIRIKINTFTLVKQILDASFTSEAGFAVALFLF